MNDEMLRAFSLLPLRRSDRSARAPGYGYNPALAIAKRLNRTSVSRQKRMVLGITGGIGGGQSGELMHLFSCRKKLKKRPGADKNRLKEDA